MAGLSYLSSPDQISPYYPERFIRPLPKRTIRSRLSEEVAEKIAYPPNPPSASLPSYSPYEFEHEHEAFENEDEHDESCPHHPHHHHHHCHHDDDEDELDSVEDASPMTAKNAYRRSSPRPLRGQRHARTSSFGGKSAAVLDGYEAFENTNNKKKRKIPTSGSLSLHQSSLGSELSHGGPTSRDPSADEIGVYDAAPSGLGVQGAGRGRAGRKSSARNPLGPSTNTANVRAIHKYDQNQPNGDGAKSDQGIISKAIANATTLLKTPSRRDQENVGVLEKQTKTTPTNSQFTFTCESDSKGVKFPEQSLYSPDYAHRVDSTTSTSPMMQSQRYSNQAAQTAQYTNTVAQTHPPPQTSTQASAPQQRARPRRRKGDLYILAAKQRRLQQEYQNLQHPPAPEDIWICEFCEYESIFGSQPQALIRQYEIKDRKERKRLAEKRRLLEKAKLKGRKGKKQTKSAAKAANAAAAQAPVNTQDYDQDQTLDDGMDDYLDQGYDDDPVPMPAPALPAVKQPMPGLYDKRGGGRTGSATAGVAGGGAGGGTTRLH